jgi:hypothetical protein
MGRVSDLLGANLHIFYYKRTDRPKINAFIIHQRRGVDRNDYISETLFKLACNLSITSGYFTDCKFIEDSISTDQINRGSAFENRITLLVRVNQLMLVRTGI